MKNLILSTTLALFATPALATEFSVTGEVTGVWPITGYETVSSVETRCFDERVEVPGQNNAGAGALTGAIIGGIIGDVISSGNGNATAGGALMGAIIGADKGSQNSRPAHTETQRTCQDVTVHNRREVIEYYEVEYEWNGFEGTFQTVDSSYRVGQNVSLTLELRRF